MTSLGLRRRSAAVRAAGWALVALHRLRREISAQGLDVEVQSPSVTPAGAVRGVETALRWRRATCLERSLIVQRWLMANGDPHEVLVGVTGGSTEAHAWIDQYDPPDEGKGFEVLARVAPRE